MSEGHHLLNDLPSGKFHSAVLSTYCLDFAFLEQRFVGALRSRGIRNIAVIADGRLVEDAIATGIENVRRVTSLYSLSTYECPGAFHPKLHFYSGDAALMLVIGSGNLTSGGLGKNSETFITLFADSTNRSQLPLLLKAWMYLRRSCGSFSGIAEKQLSWMERHCSLFNGVDLQASLNGDEKLLQVKKDLDLCFLTSEGIGLWARLSRLIESPASIRRITIVSPYFDNEGKLLLKFLGHFPHAQIQILVQSATAALPWKMKSNKRVSFHEWDSCNTGKALAFRESVRMLHSKLFLFAGDRFSHLLIGSANASEQAFSSANHANKEAVLLMRSSKSWALALGIDKLGPAIPLPNENSASRIGAPQIVRRHYQIKIQAADVTATACTLYLQRSALNDSVIYAVFLSASGELIFTSKILLAKKEILTIKEGTSGGLRNATLVYLRKEDGEIISNTQVLNNERAIWNTNPDPKNRKLQHLIDRVDNGEYSELDLYDCYNLLFNETEDPSPKVRSHKKTTATGEKRDSHIPTLEEAKKELLETDSSSFHFSEEAPTMLLDAYLARLAKENDERASEDMDDEETGDIKTGNTRVDREKRKRVFSNEASLIRQREKVANFYQRYSEQLLAAGGRDYQIDTRDYAFFLLALSHAVRLAGHDFRVVHDGGDNYDAVIPIGGSVHSYSSFNSIALNVIGKFHHFLKCGAGDRNYENPYADAQLIHFKRLSLGAILNAISILSERRAPADVERVRRWHLLLLINTFDVFGTSNVDLMDCMQASAKVMQLGDGVESDHFLELNNAAHELFLGICKLRVGEYSKQLGIHCSSEIGYSYVHQYIPKADRPKALKVVTLAAFFDKDDFIYPQVYNLDFKRWMNTKPS